LKSARDLSQRAIALAKQGGQKERAAMFEAGGAVREAFFGNLREARQGATNALELSNARDVEYGASFALALGGDLAGSQKLAKDLDKRFPEDTFVRFTYLPVLNALAALNRSDPAGAIGLLQASLPYERGIPGSWFGFFGDRYPAYVRGLAYLAAHAGKDAALEFQKILQDTNLVWSDPVGVAARLQLARALVLSGEFSKAQDAYVEFLARLKDADPDIPILGHARGESARLQ
jgi:hypothetical protein